MSEPAGSSVNNRRIFWAGVVVGGATIAYGTRGLLQHTSSTHPRAFARIFLGVNLVHDLVLVPLVLVLGVAVARAIPRGGRAAAQGGLLCAGVVTLYAMPLVLGYGRKGRSSSVLPLNYARGLLTVLAIVAAVTAVLIVKGALREDR